MYCGFLFHIPPTAYCLLFLATRNTLACLIGISLTKYLPLPRGEKNEKGVGSTCYIVFPTKQEVKLQVTSPHLTSILLSSRFPQPRYAVKPFLSLDGIPTTVVATFSGVLSLHPSLRPAHPVLFLHFKNSLPFWRGSINRQLEMRTRSALPRGLYSSR